MLCSMQVIVAAYDYSVRRRFSLMSELLAIPILEGGAERTRTRLKRPFREYRANWLSQLLCASRVVT